MVNVNLKATEKQILIDVDKDAEARVLFDQAVQKLEIKEPWFFGLEYTHDKTNETKWMDLNSKILVHPIKKTPPLQIQFKVRFYPGDVIENIVADDTREYFYYQVKHDVLDCTLPASVDSAIILAAYACQAKFGEFKEEIHTAGYLNGQKMLPDGMFEQGEWTWPQWERRISHWHKVFSKLIRPQAIEGYLKTAQNLPYFGVSYFTIESSEGVVHVLGVDCKSVSFFDWHNREAPLQDRCFSWADIDKIKASGRHFIVDHITNLNDDYRRDSEQSMASSAGGQNRRGINGGRKKQKLRIKNYTVKVVSKNYCEEMLDECAGYHAIWMYCREGDTKQLRELREQQRLLRAKQLKLDGSIGKGILKSIDYNSTRSGSYQYNQSTNYPRSTDASSQHRLSEQIYNNAVQDIHLNLAELESDKYSFNDEKYNEVIDKLERMEQLLRNLHLKSPRDVQRRESVSNDLKLRLDRLNTQKEIDNSVLKFYLQFVV